MTAAHDRFAHWSCQDKIYGLSTSEWAVLLWSLAVLLARFLMLSQSPFANGLDGYYYAEQIRSFRLLGHFIIVDNSPVLYFMAALDFVGGDPIMSTKLSSALFAAWLCLAIFYCLRKIGGTDKHALVAAILIGLSPSYSFLAVDYVKNIGALVVFFISVGWLAQWFSAPRWNIRALLMGLGLFVICFTAHRITGLLLCLYILGLMVQKGRSWALFSAVSCAIIGVIIGGLSLIKGGLVLVDISRVLPALAWGQSLAWQSEAFRQALPLAVLLELSAAGLIAPTLVTSLQRLRPAARALIPCTLVLFLPFWDLSVLDLGFRLQSNGVALVLVLITLVLPSLSRFLLPGLLLMIALLILPFNQAMYRLSTDPPFALYQKVIEHIELPADSLLICHPGLNNFYTYHHQLKDALAFLPEFVVPVEKLWRLSHGVAMEEYRRLIPEFVNKQMVHKQAGPYILIREDAFQTFRKRCDTQRLATLDNWFNPHTQRPDFLLAKNQ